MGKSCLIVGGGPAGCAAAHQLTLMGGWDITLIEQGPFLGGGGRTFFYGGHPYTFGPRHFLTQNEKVFNYLNRYQPLRRCNEHIFLTYVEQDHNFYNYPIHTDDIWKMPDGEEVYRDLEFYTRLKQSTELSSTNLEEYWIHSVGTKLYEKFIKKYSQKMWNIPAHKIDTFSWSPKGVALKSGPRAAWDTAISAYPTAHDGYNNWFNIATDGVNVHLNTKVECWNMVGKAVCIDNEWLHPDLLIITISPDIPFHCALGELPYMGRDFHKFILPIEFAFPKDVYCVYYAGDEKFTRITEYKKFTQYQSDQTLLGMEIPSQNGKFYPLPVKGFQELAKMYHNRMGHNIYCLGRNGSYRYSLDIAACIEQTMELVEVLKAGGSNETVIGAKWNTIQ